MDYYIRDYFNEIADLAMFVGAFLLGMSENLTADHHRGAAENVDIARSAILRLLENLADGLPRRDPDVYFPRY
jgi:hypothetical protein